MKKQILTLTMCLALTTTAALAEVTKTMPQKPVPQAKVSTAIPVKPDVKTLPTTNLGAQPEQPKRITSEEAKKYFEEKQAKQRDHMYNDLGFTPEQKAKAEALDIKAKKEVAPLMSKLKLESKKLKELKTKKASTFKIWQQENTVKSAKKALKKHFEASRKAFEEILTPEQKTKFEARKKEMDKFRKNHKHGGAKGHNAPENMGPPPAGIGPNGQIGPEVQGGPAGPQPMGPPPERK